MTGQLTDAIFRLRLAAFVKAAYLGGLRIEQRELAEILRQKDGDDAWQAIVALDHRARRRENGLFRRLRRRWLRGMFGK